MAAGEEAPPASRLYASPQAARPVAEPIAPGELFDRDVRRAVARLVRDGRFGRRVAVLVTNN